MTDALEALANMEYPGRAIILGMNEDGDQRVAIYILSGRSTSSQARKAESYEKHGFVNIEPTDRKVLESGSPSLLLYPALFVTHKVPSPSGEPRPEFGGNIVGVSNGAQTNLLYSLLQRKFGFKSQAGYVLQEAFKVPDFRLDPKFGEIDITSFEPDHPNYTPRVSGLALEKRAGLHIVRRGADGTKDPEFHEFDYDAGEGKLIATYDGVDTGREPLHPFTGEPLDVKLEGRTAEETAQAVYDALNQAVRVAVIAAYVPKDGEIDLHIVNRHDLGGE